MANASVLHENLADQATLTASSWLASASPSMLKNPHVRRRWKSRPGDNQYVLADFGGLRSIDTVALLSLQGIFATTQRNLSAAANTRVRLSTVDASGEAGNAHDSTLAAGRVNGEFGNLVYLLAGPVSARYLRIDVSEAGSEAILAGRLIAGRRNAFTVNFAYGWSYGYSDLSRKDKSAGGQTFVDRDDRYRALNLNFGFVSEGDRYGFIDEIERENGESRDVLMILNQESPRLDRDSVWGLLKDTSPVTQPFFDVFAKTYAIEERL